MDRENLKPFEYYTLFTRRLMLALDRWFDDLSGKVGLTSSELKVLIFLNADPTNDTAQWVADCLSISKALVSKVVEQLCSKGYLKQVQDTTDRRRYHLIVQPAAKPLIEKLDEDFIQSWKLMSDGISDEELECYVSVLSRIVSNLSDRLGCGCQPRPKSE